MALEGGGDFFELVAEDAGEDEVAGGLVGGFERRDDLDEEVTEEIGEDEVVAGGGLPGGDVGAGDFDSGDGVEFGVLFGDADAGRVVVEGFDAGGSEGAGGEGEDAGAGAGVERGPVGGEFATEVGEHPEATGGGSVVAGAEGHTGRDVNAGLFLRGGLPFGEAEFVGKYGEATADVQRGAGGDGIAGPEGGFGDFAAELLDEFGGGSFVDEGFDADGFAVGPGDEGDAVGAEKGEALGPGVFPFGGGEAGPAVHGWLVLRVEGWGLSG